MILRRDETGWDFHETEAGKGQQTNVEEKNECAAARDDRDDTAIAPRGSIEASIEQPEKPSKQEIPSAAQPILSGSVRLEKNPAKRGAERQGHKTRKQCRDGDGQRELPVKLAGDPADEGCRDKDGAEHEGDRHQGTSDFLHGLDGRLARTEPLGEVALDVLHDDDRIVDHDAYRQDQSKQRQVIEGKAKGRHHGEGAHERNRNRQDGNNRSPPGLEERQDHQDDQQRRLENRVD